MPYDDTMILHHFTLCPLSRQVRLMAGEANIELKLVEQKPWELDEQFFFLNPSGELPVLISDGGGERGGGSAVTVASIHAIGEFIAERFARRGAGMGMLPETSEQRAEARRLVWWFNEKLNNEVSQQLLNQRVYQSFARGSADSAVIKLARQALRLHLEYIESILPQRDWLVGSTPSWADFALAGHISMLDYIGDVPWGDYEHVATWYRRIKSRPCFRPLLKDWVSGVTASTTYADLDF